MLFNNNKARRQFIEQGIVATMRNPHFKFMYEIGKSYQIWQKNYSGEKKFHGWGRVLKLLPNTKENREKYRHISGFDSVEEWEQAAMKFDSSLPEKIIIVKKVEHGVHKKKKKWTE